MEGFLNKQGEKGLVLNLWRKRWFQLDPVAQRMYYYKTKGKEELLGYINLAEGTAFCDELYLLEYSIDGQSEIGAKPGIDASLFDFLCLFSQRSGINRTQR